MSIVSPSPAQKLQAIQWVLRAIRAASRRCMQSSVQGLLDGFVLAGLGQEITPWSCQHCSTREPLDFRRNGVYQRKLATLCGVIELAVLRRGVYLSRSTSSAGWRTSPCRLWEPSPAAQTRFKWTDSTGTSGDNCPTAGMTTATPYSSP